MIQEKGVREAFAQISGIQDADLLDQAVKAYESF